MSQASWHQLDGTAATRLVVLAQDRLALSSLILFQIFCWISWGQGTLPCQALYVCVALAWSHLRSLSCGGRLGKALL